MHVHMCAGIIMSECTGAHRASWGLEDNLGCRSSSGLTALFSELVLDHGTGLVRQARLAAGQ